MFLFVVTEHWRLFASPTTWSDLDKNRRRLGCSFPPEIHAKFQVLIIPGPITRALSKKAIGSIQIFIDIPEWIKFVGNRTNDKRITSQDRRLDTGGTQQISHRLCKVIGWWNKLFCCHLHWVGTITYNKWINHTYFYSILYLFNNNSITSK